MQNLYAVIFCAIKSHVLMIDTIQTCSHVLNCFSGWLWNWYGI